MRARCARLSDEQGKYSELKKVGRPFGNICRRISILVAGCAFVMLWQHAARSVCRGNGCYRVGNFIDFWIQRELLASLQSSITGPSDQCASIVRGIWLRRFLRLEFTHAQTLLEKLSSQRLSKPPAASFWSDAAVENGLRQTLEEWETSTDAKNFPFVWWHHQQLRHLLPFVKPQLQSLLHAIPHTHVANDTCVVHFRTGDFFLEQRRGWKVRQLHLSIAALISAADTFPQPPRSFEVLGGGFDHNCDSATSDCGTATLQLIKRGLRRAYPSAEVVFVGGSPDEDFARAARAPMLLIGCDGTEMKTGSSFAVYAAAASDGHVRSPACFLRYAACMSDGETMGLRWTGYRHPNCKQCRDLQSDAREWRRIEKAVATLDDQKPN